MASESVAQSAVLQADKIDWTLRSYGIAAMVQSVDVLPRFVAYRMSVQMGVRVSAVMAVERELAMALRVENVRVVQRDGTVVIEVPRSDLQTVHLYKLLPKVNVMSGGPLRACAALLGLDDYGQPLMLALPSPDVAHVLIAGTTGAGKTVLARSMALSLAWYNARRSVQLGLLDPKGRAYGQIRGAGNTVFYETDPGRALGRMRWLVEQMLRRDQEQRCEPRLVLFIDELADLVMASGEVREALTRLTQRGREAGIHVIACTQKPSAEIMGALAKANFPTRIVGKVPSADVAVACAGVAGTGAESLQGRGDFLLVWAGQVSRFQAAYASDSDISEMMNTKFAGVRVAEVPLEDRLVSRDLDQGAERVGRPADPVTAEMVEAVRSYVAEQGAEPSAKWVRQRFKCGNDRARRAIEAAR